MELNYEYQEMWKKVLAHRCSLEDYLESFPVFPISLLGKAKVAKVFTSKGGLLHEGTTPAREPQLYRNCDGLPAVSLDCTSVLVVSYFP